MHLVFPPLFPSGLLKSKIPPTTLKCASALACVFSFFLLLCAEIFALAAAAEQMCLGDASLGQPAFYTPLLHAEHPPLVPPRSCRFLPRTPPSPVVPQLRG